MKKIVIAKPFLFSAFFAFFSLAAISKVDMVSANMEMMIPLGERLATLEERNDITADQHNSIVNKFANEEILNAEMEEHDRKSQNVLPKLDDEVADAFRMWLQQEVNDGHMTEFMANHLRGLFKLGPPPNYKNVPLSKKSGAVSANYSGNGIVEFLARSAYFSGPGVYNGIWGYRKQNREYALHCNGVGLNILDVTDAESGTIVKVQAIPMGGGQTWRDVATEGDYAYVAAQGGSVGKANLWVVHLIELSGDSAHGIDSNPISESNIKWISGYKDKGHTVNVWNGLLFLNGASNTNGCIIFDIATDPMNPVELHTWKKGDCHDSFAKQMYYGGGEKDIMFSADGRYGKYRIIDITNINNGNYQFNQIGSTQNVFAYAHQNVVSDDGQTLFVFEESNSFDIGAYSISDLDDPKLITEFQWSGDEQNNARVHNGFVRGNLLFVAYYTAGLRVFDISDVYNIVEVGKLETYRDYNMDGNFENAINPGYNGAWNVYVDLPSGKVLISDANYGLFVVGIDEEYTSAPQKPSTPAPTSAPQTSPASTCRSVGIYSYLNRKFCRGRANKGSAKYARFWEVRPGKKKEVLNGVCKGTPCKKADCCKKGPPRNCITTGNQGLIEGGFTQKMCGGKWTLKKASSRKKAACTGKNGYRCMRKNCCTSKSNNIFKMNND